MRLLWLSHFIPFPPRGGNVQRSYNLIRQAAKSFDVSLVALNVQGAMPEQVAEHRNALAGLCADVEIWDLPYPWKGRRWQAELVRSAASPVPFTFRPLYSEELGRRWAEKLARHPGPLVHIDAIDLALFAGAADGFRKVLNHHNCESALLSRRAARETNLLKRKYLELEAGKLARWERKLSGRFQVNAVVSEEDAQLLRAMNPAAHIHVVENGVDTDYFRPTDAPEEPRSLIFTGSLDWQPNISAIQYFAQEVWPLVKRGCPDAKLLVAGKSPAESVLRLAERDSSITVFPSPADMRPLLARASVYICPLLEGGGTRLKILDAMAMGKPVVSTPVGCEGLRVTPGENILVGDTAQALAELALRLLASEELRAQLACSARQLVEREYAWNHVSHQLESAYHCALGVNGCAGPRP
ncbi:MAG TPA: glycosyltransferase family 4 protein [Patescibacteria group bacterium]|nr:glycosyltransferase family 4 protein [Patescibacteria group bacterium]